MRDLSRAQQRFLGLAGPLHTRTDGETQIPHLVTCTEEVKDIFTAQACTTGHYKGGLLFGRRQEGSLHIVAVAPAGYTCLTPCLRTEALACDERYALGWSDCLSVLHGGEVDWVGNWVTRPDGQLGAVEDHLLWLRQGLETDLFNERHVLLCLGWQESVLGARVYAYSRDINQVLTLSYDLSGF